MKKRTRKYGWMVEMKFSTKISIFCVAVLALIAVSVFICILSSTKITPKPVTVVSVRKDISSLEEDIKKALHRVAEYKKTVPARLMRERDLSIEAALLRNTVEEKDARKMTLDALELYLSQDYDHKDERLLPSKYGNLIVGYIRDVPVWRYKEW